MKHSLPLAGLATLAALALPAAATANSRTLSVPTPAVGNVTVAHVILPLGPGTVPRRASAVLTNAGRVPDGVLVLAGARKGKGRALTGSVIVVSPRDRAAGVAAAKVEFRVSRRGAQFQGKPKIALGQNVVGARRKPPYCGAAPRRVGHIRRLIGTLVEGFSAARTAKFAYLLGCAQFPQRDEFVNSFGGGNGGRDQTPDGDGGEGGDGGGTSPGGGGEEEDDPCADVVDDPSTPDNELSDCEDARDNPPPPMSSTLQGSGSVIDEGNGIYRYEISFNEPVYGFEIRIASGTVRCPTEYGDWKSAECDPLGDSQSPDAGGTSMTCGGQHFGDGQYVYELECSTPAPERSGDRTAPAAQTTVPAGPLIKGRFTVQSGSTVGPAKLIGHGPNGQSQAATLTGP